MPYAQPFKIANGLVLDFTVDGADTANDTFLGLNSIGEVTNFSNIPRSRVSGGGNLTEATSSVLSITGGTAAVLTSGLTIQVLQAGAAQSGYLSTTDWNTFNNKLGPSLTSAYIYVGNGSNVATGVAVSGDITMSNAGVVAIASGVIVNADINASAAIAVSKLAAVTASRVLGSDGSGFIQALDTATYPSLTELAYGKGVTSSIQTQLNNRLAVTLSSPTNGDVITYNGAAWVNSPSSTGVPTAGTTAQILRKIDNTNYNTEWHTLVAADITDVSSTAAELNLLDGVTTTTAQFNFLNTVSGNVQDQLDSKLGITLTQNYMWVGNGSNLATGLAPGTNGYVLTSVSGVPTWVNPGSGGTVTSINASGGTTGMSFTGGPVTTSGTLTLGGTLAVANGGTGLTALGTANQSIRVNAGATALEYYTPSVGSGDMILASTQTNTGAKSFNSGTFILKGATSGTTIFNAAATAGSTTITLPNFTGQALASGGTQALSGNTIIGGSGSNYNLSLGDTGAEIGTFTVLTAGATSISSSTASTSSLNVGDYTGSLRNGPRGYEASPTGIFIFANAGQYIEGDVTGFKFVLGSDASQDLYKRDPSGYLVRIPLGSSGDVLTNVSGTVGWAAPASASGAWLLASGGTATGTNTFAMGSNPFILTSGVTTGTGATAGIQNVFNSLTTGNGLDISSSSVSSGAIVKITGTGTAAASNTQSGLVVDVSGANATSTQTTHAGYFSNTKTGTSSSNIALYANASGATNNMAIYAPNGVVSLGAVPSGYNGRICSTAGTGGRVALFGNLEITTSVGPGWSGTGIQVVGSNRKLSFYGGNWGTDNDQVDVSWNATSVNRSGVDLGILRSSLGAFNTTFFQANSIAGFRFIDTWPTLTTPLNVVYGFDYSAGGAGNAVSEVAIRATRGQVVLGDTGTSSANDRVKINGIGTTTGKGLVVNNSSGSERFSVQDNGVINVNGSGGTAGQVLVSNGTSAAAWAAGGGITNGAANTELMMSNGTNAIASGIFATAATGSLTLGSGSITGDRIIQVASSSTNANININAKAGGNVYVQGSAFGVWNSTSTQILVLNARDSGLGYGPSIQPVLISGTINPFVIKGATGISGSTTGMDLSLVGGDGLLSGSTNAGSVSITSGLPSSGGTEGSVNIQSRSVGKLGFFNTTAIVQPTTGITAATFTANTSLIANDTATFDGYTIGQIVKALRNLGVIA